MPRDNLILLDHHRPRPALQAVPDDNRFGARAGELARPQAGPRAQAPRRSNLLSAYLLHDGSLDVRKADRPAPRGAICLYAAFGPHHTPAIKRLFAKKADGRGRRAIEARGEPWSKARFQIIAAVYRERARQAVEGNHAG